MLYYCDLGDRPCFQLLGGSKWWKCLGERNDKLLGQILPLGMKAIDSYIMKDLSESVEHLSSCSSLVLYCGSRKINYITLKFANLEI